MTGPALPLEQGYDVVVDALSRTKHKKPPSRERYASDIQKYFEGTHWCVLAGLIDGRLGGYLDGYVVDGIGYGVNAYYASWALPTNLSTGLVFEFAQIVPPARRRPHDCGRPGRARGAPAGPVQG